MNTRHTMPAARTAATVAVLAVTLIGCAGRADTAADIPAAELQTGLAGKLAADGRSPTSVICPRGLKGAVGSLGRCEVAFSDSDTVTVLLTMLGSQDGAASYEITRVELTREQLAKRVAAASAAASASCEFGLDGQPGDFAQCQVVKGGVTFPVTAEVTGVKGSMIDLSVTQFMPKDQVEETLSAKLAPALGQRPDSVNCPSELVGQFGATMECVVNSGGTPKPYVLTVTGVGPGTVFFSAVPKVTS